jgi:hypothetical protein
MQQIEGFRAVVRRTGLRGYDQVKAPGLRLKPPECRGYKETTLCRTELKRSTISLEPFTTNTVWPLAWTTGAVPDAALFQGSPDPSLGRRETPSNPLGAHRTDRSVRRRLKFHRSHLASNLGSLADLGVADRTLIDPPLVVRVGPRLGNWPANPVRVIDDDPRPALR